MSSLIWTTTGRPVRIDVEALQVEPFPLLADEPVSVAEVVRHLKWPSGTPEEQDIPRWIAAARTTIERDTGLALVTQTWDLFLDDWGAVPGYIRLPLHPIVSIDDVVTIDDDDDETDVETFSLVSGRPARLLFTSVPSLSASRLVAPVRIRYTAGYTTDSLPVDLKQAVLMQVADLTRHRGDEREALTGRTVSAARALVERYIPAGVA